MHIQRVSLPAQPLLRARDLKDGLRILSVLVAREGLRERMALVGSSPATLIGVRGGANDVDLYLPSPSAQRPVYNLEAEVNSHLRHLRQMRAAADQVVRPVSHAAANFILDRASSFVRRAKGFAKWHFNDPYYFQRVRFRDTGQAHGLAIWMPTPKAMMALRLADSRLEIRQSDMRELWLLADHLGIDTRSETGFKKGMSDFWGRHRDNVPYPDDADIDQKVRLVWENRKGPATTQRLGQRVTRMTEALKAGLD